MSSRAPVPSRAPREDMMLSANRWCVFANADALLVPRDESGSPRREAAFNRAVHGGPRCLSSNSASTQGAMARCKFLRLRRQSMARLLCTIDKIDRDLERTEQPGCRTTRHFQRGKR